MREVPTMSSTVRAATFIDKGGTGKTTVTAHLGVACARQGHEVLLIDLAGKQGDLAKHFGIWEHYQDLIDADEAWPNIATVFNDQWNAIADKLGDDAVRNLIFRTDERVDIIPAHPNLDGVDTELANIDDTETRYSLLTQFLDEYIDPLRYDVVLIDLPGLTNNVSYNGLWAASNVIAPVEPSAFEAQQAERLDADMAQIREQFVEDMTLTMVIPNKVDTRTRLADEYLDVFTDEYPAAIAPEHVPDSQDIRNAIEEGHSVFRLESPSQTAEQARSAFVKNAKTLIQRLKEGD